MAKRIEFWERLRDKRQEVPADSSRSLLLAELSSHLGDPDPRWRDEVAFTLLGRWIYRQGLNDDERRQLLKDSLLQLSKGLGRKGDNSVFLRSFSALILCYLVERDLIHPFLRPADLRRILASALHAMGGEQDLRGFVPNKGWAHAMAHLADLLDALAKSPHVSRQDLQRILRAIAKKLCTPSSTILGYGEPTRLARAVNTLLDRNLVPASFVRSWVVAFSRATRGRTWSRVSDSPNDVNARTNVTLFLSSLVILAHQTGDGRQRVKTADLARNVLRQMADGF